MAQTLKQNDIIILTQFSNFENWVFFLLGLFGQFPKNPIENPQFLPFFVKNF
jgi:hypothetical protein